jgi:hypothetical protein
MDMKARGSAVAVCHREAIHIELLVQRANSSIAMCFILLSVSVER